MSKDQKISGASPEVTSIVKEDILDRSLPERANILKGKKIGISISESDDLAELGLSEIHLKDAMIEFARYLLVHGATLVYGGDLRDKGYTFLFSELAYLYRDKTEQEQSHFINYFAFPIYNLLTTQHKLDFKRNRVEIKEITPDWPGIDARKFLAPNDDQNRLIWAESITKMRRELNGNVDARIIIGGRMTKYAGRIPGLIEEATLALFSDKPTYLIGTFGGATLKIIQALLGEQPEQLTQSWQIKNEQYNRFLSFYNTNQPTNQINYAQMVTDINAYGLKRYSKNNGLSEEENMRLFTSQHLPETIFLTLKGLSKVLK